VRWLLSHETAMMQGKPRPGAARLVDREMVHRRLAGQKPFSARRAGIPQGSND